MEETKNENLRSIGSSRITMESVLKKEKEYMVGMICGKDRF